jgi:hypothetical protein
VAEHCLEVIDMIEHSVVAGDLYLAVPQLYARIARAQVEMGDLVAAEHSIGAGFLLDPSEPTLWVAQALLQQGRNMPQLALASVNYALAIWHDADEDYVVANRARTLATELQDVVQ